jgi:hypothetical protein
MVACQNDFGLGSPGEDLSQEFESCGAMRADVGENDIVVLLGDPRLSLGFITSCLHLVAAAADPSREMRERFVTIND